MTIVNIKNAVIICFLLIFFTTLQFMTKKNYYECILNFIFSELDLKINIFPKINDFYIKANIAKKWLHFCNHFDFEIYYFKLIFKIFLVFY